MYLIGFHWQIGREPIQLEEEFSGFKHKAMVPWKVVHFFNDSIPLFNVQTVTDMWCNAYNKLREFINVGSLDRYWSDII